ncbi:MAG TPA: TetR/AcrR family transcriptional regulator [Kofleriaceae bacterium]|jgi:AcrR family transcriptional regulator|nr:TetR/AcrR family transcriptional regulator [Kofleriaceae bacterium]
MPSKTSERSARERLLAAANELFYKEGIHTVGIDRVIEKAGVAKASLYSTFGSKDELIRAYLQGRHETRQKRIAAALAQHDTPRARICAIFDLLGESSLLPSFRGCAFVNASAEGPASKIPSVCQDSRAWLRSLFTELARDAGAKDPDTLGRQLAILYDGAMVSSSVDRDVTAAETAKSIATALVDAA